MKLLFISTSYPPRGGETICPRRWQFDLRWIYVVCGQIHSLHMAKLQAANMPIAYGSCTMEQTDGRIAVSLNGALCRGA